MKPPNRQVFSAGVAPDPLPGGSGNGVPGGPMTDPAAALLADAVRTGCAPAARGVQSPLVLAMIEAAHWLATEPAAPDQIMPEVFDTGDKVLIIGKSKLRKSFYALQMALCLAAGRAFLCWPGGKPRRVLLIQMEVKPGHFHKRVRNMAAVLGITAVELGDRLIIVNGRGRDLSGDEGMEAIIGAARTHRAEVVILDPLYKLARGDENLAADLKPTLAQFDRLAELTGAAVIIIHHDPKGEAGERDVRDRGAGSSVLSRDYDACFAMSAHAAEEGAAVVDLLLRNYPPQLPVSIGWGQGCFEVRGDLPAVKKTSRTRSAGPALAEYIPAAEALLKKGALDIADFKARFRDKTGLTLQRVKDFCTEFAGEDKHFPTIERKGRGLNEKKIGTPEQIAKLQGWGGL